MKSFACFLLVLKLAACCYINPEGEKEPVNIQLEAPITGDGEDAETPPGNGRNNENIEK